MPTVARPSSSRPDLLVDTSVAVALVVHDHEHHATVSSAIGGLRLGLAGHTAFETYSVLTRLPPPFRRPPQAIGELLRANFPGSRFLNAEDTAALLEKLPSLGIAGGAVYDALIGAAAAAHGVRLSTRDLRAVDVYRAVDADVEILS